MKYWALQSIVFLSLMAEAHPTSYKGAFSLMSYNTPEMNEVMLTYSFSHHFAAATTYLKDSESEFYIPRLNFLVKRWNKEDSQGNIYFSAGAGYEKLNSKNHEAQLAELVMDWESRKYYVYFDHLFLNRKHNEEYNHSKLRLGTAPFLADYEDLNVWLILQADKHMNQNNIELTQLLRFYIKNTLCEVGASFNGNWAFNYMVHF